VFFLAEKAECVRLSHTKYPCCLEQHLFWQGKGNPNNLHLIAFIKSFLPNNDSVKTQGTGFSEAQGTEFSEAECYKLGSSIIKMK
jgi:hypothetical protein